MPTIRPRPRFPTTSKLPPSAQAARQRIERALADCAPGSGFGVLVEPFRTRGGRRSFVLTVATVREVHVDLDAGRASWSGVVWATVKPHHVPALEQLIRGGALRRPT